MKQRYMNLLKIFYCVKGSQLCFMSLPNTSPAYGATLIEHSLIEAGLPGSVKVDSQVEASQGRVEQLETRLQTCNYSNIDHWKCLLFF